MTRGVVIGTMVGLMCTTGFAAVPGQINHQGVIRVQGNLFTGTGQFRFAIFDPDTGQNYWTNDNTFVPGPGTPTAHVPIAVTDGVYSVRLGDTSLTGMTNVIPPSVFNDSNAALRVWFNDGVNGIQAFDPHPLTSVPYAHRIAVPGIGNQASGLHSMVGGGQLNTAGGDYSAVAGGSSNVASGHFSTIGGGDHSVASGDNSMVAGGYYSQAVGFASFAAGKNARANHDGSFVWADNQGFQMDSAAPNDFTVRAAGGARFFSSFNSLNTGVSLAPGGGSWSSISDRHVKRNIEPVDPRSVLEHVSAVPVATWNYESQTESIRHMGPMAQDFYAAFAIGEDERFITSIDADGVALAAIQGLYQIVQENECEIEKLKVRVVAAENLEAKITALEALVSKLAAQNQAGR